MNDGSDFPGPGTNGSGSPWPEWLCAAWDGLQDGPQRTLAGPWDSEIQPRLGTDLGTLLLRQRGLTVEQVVEAAGFFPNGLGSLRHYPGGVGKLIRELWDERDAAAARAEAERKAREEAKLLTWRAPTAIETAIPRRTYVVPGYIQRGVVTEIVGPGGHGKSLLFLIWAVALALGVPFGGFRPTAPMRVCTLDAEDDLDEQDRRVAAILRMFGKHHCDLGDRLRIMNPVRTGMMLQFDPVTRQLTETGLMAEVLDAIHDFKPDLLMLKPLGELHNAEENDNGVLRNIVSSFRVLAKQENIGILIGHHTRKGVPEHGNADAGRGASSIGGVVRKSYTLYEMTLAEAAGWKIAEPRMYFRLDGAKANYDQKNGTEWFERQIVLLDNLDQAVAAIPWFPPSEAITDEIIASLMAVVAAGDGGQPWTRRLGKYDRSISRAMEKAGIETRDGQEKLLDVLLAKGCHECTFAKPNRSPAMGLRHPNGGPNVPWKT